MAKVILIRGPLPDYRYGVETLARAEMRVEGLMDIHGNSTLEIAGDNNDIFTVDASEHYQGSADYKEKLDG